MYPFTCILHPLSTTLSTPSCFGVQSLEDTAGQAHPQRVRATTAKASLAELAAPGGSESIPYSSGQGLVAGRAPVESFLELSSEVGH